jgi:arylsulfatase A-like enzyme/tetratricopeptide (TPR) repeat protein
VLDSLAQHAVVFDQAVSPVPITLPAHTTLMTGLDPYEHGMRHNAIFTVSEDLVTLAERFKERGYATAAFIGGYPLHGSFGLDQGFDVYDDDLSDRAFAAIKETAERTAPEVNEAVFEWAAAGVSSPFFLWVHYFDPHYPYVAPAQFRERFPSDPYRAEVALTDRELGRLLDRLGDAGLLEETVILIVGDHGESLGEHKESTHSFFVYDATQLVPCLLIPPPSWSGPALAGTKVADQVRLRDLPATIANLLGWPRGDWDALGSASLLPLMTGGAAPAAPPVAYVESLVPALEYGWSDLRGVRTAHWKYIRAPQPELYDLTRDPAETDNVVDDHPGAARHLEAWLDWYIAGESDEALAPEDIDPEVEERLRSLGYLGGGVAQGEETGADPKDRIEVHVAIGLARQRGADYLYEDAVQILRPVVRQYPHLLEARRLLALYSYMTGDLETSRELYEDLARRDPEEMRYKTEIVPVLIAAGEAGRALALVEEVEAENPEQDGLYFLKGQVLEALGRKVAAIEAYGREAERDPGNASPMWNAARVLQDLGREDEAYAMLREGLAVDPENAAVLAALADLEYKNGRRGRADSLLASALHWDPNEPRANFIVGWQKRRAGDIMASKDAYLRALRAKPDFAEARSNLGVLYLELSQPEQAREVFETGLAMGMDSADTRLNLGVALAQLGRVREAAEHWDAGLEMNPSSETAGRLRQNLNQAQQILRSQTP